MAEVQSRGVSCFSGSCPEIYLEKAYADRGYGPAQRLPNAIRLGETSLAFLVDPSEDSAAMANTASVVRDVIRGASAA